MYAMGGGGQGVSWVGGSGQWAVGSGQWAVWVDECKSNCSAATISHVILERSEGSES